REAAEALRVIAAVAQDRRVDHARAEDLQPAGILADPAALPAAEEALDVELDARLSKGEVARPEAHTRALAIQSLSERCQRALQIGKGDVLAHRQALDLMEHHLRARGHLLIAIDLARQDHPHRPGRIV